MKKILTGETLYKGNTDEAIVLTAYIQAGFLVSLPFGGGAPYDFIVDTGSGLVKVQVKSGRVVNGRILFNTRRHRGAKNNTFRSYEIGDLDIFAIWCPAIQKLFAVSADEMSSNEGCLRINDPQNFQKKKIRWAKDYDWDTHIEKLRRSVVNSTLDGNTIKIL